jgi:hypothetical protein
MLLLKNLSVNNKLMDTFCYVLLLELTVVVPKGREGNRYRLPGPAVRKVALSPNVLNMFLSFSVVLLCVDCTN